MHIKFKGEDLGEFNGQPRLAEARLIKKELSMLPLEFAEALQKADPDAMCMLVAIMLARAGRSVAWDQIDGEFTDIESVLTAEEQAQVDAAEKGGADVLGKDASTASPAAASPGSSGTESTEPPLTWTGPSPVTPQDSGSTSD